MISNNRKIGIIILSRFNSSRLPGKALIEFDGKPLLAKIIERLSYVFGKNDITIATSAESSDDPIEKLALTEGIEVFRGDLNNVASRFFEAAANKKLDYAVRITGDSLFIDPAIVIKLLDFLKTEDFDLISNRTETYPIGQTIEIVNIETMARLIGNFNNCDDREHVTQYFYKNESALALKIHCHKNEDGRFRDLSLAVDTSEDLAQARKVIAVIGDRFRNVGYKEIYNLYKANQSLSNKY
jgi:spore coat polysaccharide biosynthesis protein SpsF (cytidylyltransferase family)